MEKTMINTFKAFLLALAAIGLLAGCATTSEEPEPAPQMTETEPEPQPEPEPEPQIDTVFRFDFDRSELKPAARAALTAHARSEEHTSELQSRGHLVCRLLLEKKKKHHET